APGIELDRFYRQNLNDADVALPLKDAQIILMLDVIEHLNDPEAFIDRLRHTCGMNEQVTLLVSTGNVAFGITRLSLLFGNFNYGKKGILDLTHTRLFTFATLKRMFQQAGYEIQEEVGIPAPFPLAVGNGWLGRLLLNINRWGIKLWRAFFSYQIFMVIKPRPTLKMLMTRAQTSSKKRARRRSV
ncbi:methyltransferase domain-containing protein, partial [Magnetococcales bacterium HHB-1]